MEYLHDLEKSLLWLCRWGRYVILLLGKRSLLEGVVHRLLMTLPSSCIGCRLNKKVK